MVHESPSVVSSNVVLLGGEVTGAAGDVETKDQFVYNVRTATVVAHVSQALQLPRLVFSSQGEVNCGLVVTWPPVRMNCWVCYTLLPRSCRWKEMFHALVLN